MHAKNSHNHENYKNSEAKLDKRICHLDKGEKENNEILDFKNENRQFASS